MCALVLGHSFSLKHGLQHSKGNVLQRAWSQVSALRKGKERAPSNMIGWVQEGAPTLSGRLVYTGSGQESSETWWKWHMMKLCKGWDMGLWCVTNCRHIYSGLTTWKTYQGLNSKGEGEREGGETPSYSPSLSSNWLPIIFHLGVGLVNVTLRMLACCLVFVIIQVLLIQRSLNCT